MATFKHMCSYDSKIQTHFKTLVNWQWFDSHVYYLCVYKFHVTQGFQEVFLSKGGKETDLEPTSATT